MRTMWIAFAAIIVISVGAFYALQNAGWSASERQAGTAVRID